MPPRQPPPDRIVAVGLLTQRDVDVLGTGFRRMYPVESTTAFNDLLRQLDVVDRCAAEPSSARTRRRS